MDGRCFASAAGVPNSDNLAPNSSNHASEGVPKVDGRWATGTEVAANPGGGDAGASLKEGNYLKVVGAGDGNNDCARLADRRMAGFSPWSAPQTGLCRRSGERFSNTAGARRAPSGRRAGASGSGKSFGSRSEVVLGHPHMAANSDGLSQSPPDLPSSARRSRLEVAPAIQRAS